MCVCLHRQQPRVWVHQVLAVRQQQRSISSQCQGATQAAHSLPLPIPSQQPSTSIQHPTHGSILMSVHEISSPFPLPKSHAS